MKTTAGTRTIIKMDFFNKFKCKECGKKIQGKGVLLLTFNNDKVLERVYFHFGCYLSWWDRCVKAKAEEIINEAAPRAYKKALNMLPKFFNNDGKQDKDSSY